MSTRIIGTKTRAQMEDEWAALIVPELTKRHKRPEGKGWVQFNELRAKFKVGHFTMRKILHRLRDEGRLETFNGHEITNGMVCRKVWYRPKAGSMGRLAP